MSPRLRKLAASLLLVAYLVIYVVLVVSLLAAPLSEASWPVQAIVFLIAGVIWIVPLRWLFRWANAASN